MNEIYLLCAWSGGHDFDVIAYDFDEARLQAEARRLEFERYSQLAAESEKTPGFYNPIHPDDRTTDWTYFVSDAVHKFVVEQ